MLKLYRRIEKLEQALALSDRFAPYVHHINFIENDGRVTATMVLSSDPELCVPYREIVEESRKEAE
jgi:hypothetical protein